jgi:elongation factor G
MNAAVRAAGALLLEPVMAVALALPPEHVGAVASDLTSAARRGRIAEMTTAATLRGAGGGEAGEAGAGAGDAVVIRALVPLRAMRGYATALRSATGGQGSFSMRFSHYAHVGAALQKALVDNPALQ